MTPDRALAPTLSSARGVRVYGICNGRFDDGIAQKSQADLDRERAEVAQRFSGLSLFRPKSNRRPTQPRAWFTSPSFPDEKLCVKDIAERVRKSTDCVRGNINSAEVSGRPIVIRGMTFKRAGVVKRIGRNARVE